MFGFIAAAKDEELSREWFDAWAHHDETVDELAYKANVERLKAAMRARYGGRGGSFFQ